MLKLRLEEVLKKKRISKYKFAQLLRVPDYAVYRFFRPGYDPKLSRLAQWAKVLNCKISDLYKE